MREGSENPVGEIIFVELCLKTSFRGGSGCRILGCGVVDQYKDKKDRRCLGAKWQPSSNTLLIMVPILDLDVPSVSRRSEEAVFLRKLPMDIRNRATMK